MTHDELKIEVQTLFPIKFEETLIYSENPSDIDRLINRALKKAFNKVEIIRGKELVGSQLFEEAASILKCVPSTTGSANMSISVWGTMGLPKDVKGSVKYYFGPDKFLRLWPDDEVVWVEYLVNSEKLSVTDLNDDYTNWVIEYAVALLKEKEGYIGTSAKLTTLPFEFNYEMMLQGAKQEKENLEERLNEMTQGTLSIRVS